LVARLNWRSAALAKSCAFFARGVATPKLRETIFAQPNANHEKPRIDFRRKLNSRKENKTVDYIVVIGALVMVGIYAALIGWLLPKH